MGKKRSRRRAGLELVRVGRREPEAFISRFIDMGRNSIGMGLMRPAAASFYRVWAIVAKQDLRLFHVRYPVQVVLQFIYLAIGTGVASFLQVSCWIVTGERQAARIRSLYLKTILRQDIAFFDKETNTGEVIGRMSGDTILIQDAMGEKVGKFIQLVSTFLGGFVIAFVKGWLLALVLLCSVPFIVMAGAALSLIISKLSARGQSAYAEAGSVVEQTVGSIRTIASFSGERQAIQKYNKFICNAYKSAVHQGTAAGLGIGSVIMLVFCSYALAVWYGAKLVLTKGYNGGQVINVMLAVMTGATSLGQASPSVSAFAAGQAAAYKMFMTIHRKPEIDSYNNNGIVLENIKGDIELKDIYFSYPARPDHLIFNGFSLHVPSGTTMALVGESGSGKSTVISLVERFYDPQAGAVLIDGINLKKFKLRWIREKIGLVSQEPVLFTTTINENISYGKEGARAAEIRKAIELANASKFIDELPNGLETMVGEHGTKLSGGQKQRIAIARAILKDPRILLLDEATSALDAESERVVQDALVNIMVDRTTIIVAHRLITVRNADTISVVQRGKLVEQGSHSELIENHDGAYSQLVRLQELNKESELAFPESLAETGLSSDAFISLKASGSLAFSQTRSISRGSSYGGCSQFSFRHSFGLPGVVETELNNTEACDDWNEDCGNTKGRKEVSIMRIAYLNKPEIPALLVGSIGAAFHGVIFPVFGILMSSSIKTFYEPPHQLRKDSRFWALMHVLLGLFSFLFVPVQYYWFGVAGGKLIERIRSLSFEKVVRQDISWFDEPANTSGAIGARLSSDAASVKSLVGDTLALVVQNLATVTAGLVIAFVANWKLTLVILVIVPLVGLQGYAQMKFLHGFSADAKIMYEEASQVASDAVTSIRTVASFCAEGKVMNAYQRKCKNPETQGIRQGLISGIGYGFSFFMLYCTYALCFYVGARFLHNGSATFTDVFRVFFALTMAANSVSQSSALAPDATKAKDSAASIFEILDRKSKIDASIDDGLMPAEVMGEIEFQHVTFKYPTRPQAQIFKDLCLRMPSGKTVALVGESGSGKSTVISLIERFYDPDSGTILIDGVEIQKLKISWLRQQMGLVSQEPVMFSGTIRSNIAYGRQGDVSEDEIIAAAEAANGHQFISSLPQGYDTNVGERGVQLSGGQKQRIAIARAMIRNPKILLLDEATSALDAESERVVQEALDRVMVGRTTISIAHRLSTIQGADIIAVVKNGVISEQGRHETLMNIPNGDYASLVSLHMAS
ncbi:ABC transporter B family member 9 [Dendrobium catenatum]|uniref:ABC transporter B family member 4 n=1 Tax=Dendrobium catenatum TaxID=906689 RepID=A0A2I0VVJ8_9ASPA|nr:ABC transporter B family member 9 [Dendrobium catenatum]PKU67429.1 ABC transporter B family member 4 [Dendrobium catenatum]